MESFLPFGQTKNREIHVERTKPFTINTRDLGSWGLSLLKTFTYYIISYKNKKRGLALSLAVLLFLSYTSFAQTKDPSAAFQISSTTQGLLPPRMTTPQRDAIANPADGLLIYNSTTKQINVYDLGVANWVEMINQRSYRISVSNIGLTSSINETGNPIIPYGYTVTEQPEAKSSTVVNFYSTNQYGENRTLVGTQDGVPTVYSGTTSDFEVPNNYLIIGVQLENEREAFSDPILVRRSTASRHYTELSMVTVTGYHSSGQPNTVNVNLGGGVRFSATTDRVRTDFTDTDFSDFFASSLNIQSDQNSYYQTMGGESTPYPDGNIEIIFETPIYLESLGHNSGVEGSSQKNYYAQVNAKFYDENDHLIVRKVTDNINSISDFFELVNPNYMIKVKRIEYQMTNARANYTGANEFYLKY